MSRVAVGVAAILGLAAAAAGAWTASKSRTWQVAGEIVARLETEAPPVALTFDDGPSARYTPEVIAILAAHDVTATFFVNGAAMADAPGAAEALVRAGHELGNHGWTHDCMILRAPGDLRADLAATA